MKHVIEKLTLVSFLLFSILLGSCKKEIEEKPLSVNISSQKVELGYEETATVNYTFTDADGKLNVSVTGLPEGVLFEDIRVDKQSGKLKFKSSIDKQESVEVKVLFKDSKNTITKNLTINLLTDRTPFSVVTESDKISISTGETEIIRYSAINADGRVTVRLKNEIPGLKLSYNFDEKNSKGEITFSTSIKEVKKIEGILVFSDGRKECEVAITFEFGKWAVVPADPIEADPIEIVI